MDQQAIAIRAKAKRRQPMPPPKTEAWAGAAWAGACAPAITGGSGRKLRTAAGAAGAEHLAATDGCRAAAEAVTAGANKIARLESALHVSPRKFAWPRRTEHKLAPKDRTKRAAEPTTT